MSASLTLEFNTLSTAGIGALSGAFGYAGPNAFVTYQPFMSNPVAASQWIPNQADTYTAASVQMLFSNSPAQMDERFTPALWRYNTPYSGSFHGFISLNAGADWADKTSQHELKIETKWRTEEERLDSIKRLIEQGRTTSIGKGEIDFLAAVCTDSATSKTSIKKLLAGIAGDLAFTYVGHPDPEIRAYALSKYYEVELHDQSLLEIAASVQADPDELLQELVREIDEDWEGMNAADPEGEILRERIFVIASQSMASQERLERNMMPLLTSNRSKIRYLTVNIMCKLVLMQGYLLAPALWKGQTYFIERDLLSSDHETAEYALAQLSYFAYNEIAEAYMWLMQIAQNPAPKWLQKTAELLLKEVDELLSKRS